MVAGFWNCKAAGWMMSKFRNKAVTHFSHSDDEGWFGLYITHASRRRGSNGTILIAKVVEEVNFGRGSSEPPIVQSKRVNADNGKWMTYRFLSWRQLQEIIGLFAWSPRTNLLLCRRAVTSVGSQISLEEVWSERKKIQTIEQEKKFPCRQWSFTSKILYSAATEWSTISTDKQIDVKLLSEFSFSIGFTFASFSS